RRLAEFAAGMRLAKVPKAVRERALQLMLDAVGVGLASRRYPFAERTLAGAKALGGDGASTVIGHRERLPLRDAALVNGVLLHGLDFDDTHLTAIIHPTVICLPAAFGVAEAQRASGADLLRAYEGRFGLFETHLQEHAAEADLGRITAGLGTTWELPDTSVKPYPICHFIHGAAEAAIRLHGKLKPTSDSLAEVRVRMPKGTLPIVAEPVAVKTAPANDYDAKFSAQYVVATCLLKGRIGLAELEPEARNDPIVRALARRVVVEADAESGYPKYMSGGVALRTTDGDRHDEY